MNVTTSSGGNCPDIARRCNDSVLFCFNGGQCCQTISDPSHVYCGCPKEWDGNRCQYGSEIYNDFMESRDNTIKMISISSAISIAVGMIALVALGVITLVIVRNSRKTRPWGFGPLEKEPDLDTTIIYVQEEISKLPTIQQLNKLQRLSKLFEKTVREAILSVPGHVVESPNSVAMNEYLPRWSSAPSCINRPPNELDVTDGDDVFEKQKLQQVFSLQGPMQGRHH